jgi:hypothetical protein
VIYGYDGGTNDDYPHFNCANQTGIYVLHDESRRIVYVGQAFSKNGIYGRLKSHSSGRFFDRWSHFSWFGFSDFSEDTNEEVTLWKETADEESLNVKAPEPIEGKQFNKKAIGAWFEAALIQLLEPKQNQRGGDWKEIPQIYQWWEEDADHSVSDVYRKLLELEQSIAKRSKP